MHHHRRRFSNLPQMQIHHDLLRSLRRSSQVFHCNRFGQFFVGNRTRLTGQPVHQMFGEALLFIIIHRRFERFCGRVGGGGRYLERDKTYSFTFSFIQRLLHSVTISYKGLYNVRIEEGRQKNRYFERRGVPLFLK